jgi:hypothetical protein
MTNVMEFLKSYFGLLAALGMGGAQFWNLRPSEQSPLAFAGFTLLTVAIMVNSVGIMRARRLVRRGSDFVPEPVHGKRPRRIAAAALVLTPLLYLILALAYHIPNTLPLAVRAGGEPPASNRWLLVRRVSSLMYLPNEFVAPLFYPESWFEKSPLLYYVMVGNRSTAASPPLTLRLYLQAAPARSEPPAQPYVVAVATPATHPLWSSSVLDRVAGQPPTGGLRSRVIGSAWLKYGGLCGERRTTGVSEWCFTSFPKPPDTRSTWRDPEIQLPPLPPRGSVEVYFELALRVARPVSIPVTITVQETSKGAFPVHVRRDFDLHAGHD